MRNVVLLFFAMLLWVAPAGAKDSASQSKRKLQGFLVTLNSMESRARPIEPLLILAQKRTAADQKEIERRYDVLFQIQEKEAKPLAREISSYRNGKVDDTLALPAQAVEDASTAFGGWLDSKLNLQNAGVNNPSLEAIRKNEKTAYSEYQSKLKAAQDALK